MLMNESVKHYDFTLESNRFPLYKTFMLPTKNFEKLKNGVNPKGHFEKSLIFSKKTKTNVENTQIRSSKKCTITDPKMFELVDSTVISYLQTLIPKHSIHMVENELEVIKYEKGDYFKLHHDFVNYVSDDMKCYALLVCLNGCDQGGQTNLYLDDKRKIQVEETKTGGGGLLFRNELMHEGCLVEKGTKIVLKINIWMFENKNLSDNKEHFGNLLHLMVKFKDDSRFYVLYHDLYKDFPQSFFTAGTHFAKKESGPSEITLSDIRFEDFDPVYQFLKTRDLSMVTQYKELFDYFGIANPEIQVFNIYNDKLLTNMNKKLDELNRFLNSSPTKSPTFRSEAPLPAKLWLVKSFEDYTTYKSILKDHKFIAPIQFMLTQNDKDEKELNMLGIYDSVIIYETPRENCDVESSEEPEHVWLECDSDNLVDLRRKMLKKYIAYKEISIDEKILSTTNDYEFLKYLMTLYFDLVSLSFDKYYWRGKPKNSVENKEEVKVDITKIKNLIKYIKENKIVEELEKINKSACLVNYTAGGYECNEASYYMVHANIYFGFIHF